MKYLDNLTSKLLKKNLSFKEFEIFLEDYDSFFDSAELELQLLISNGYPINLTDNNIFLKTAVSNIEDQTFCIVDIETSAPNIKDGQIIEIGAIRYKNGKIIEKYQSFVNTYSIPQKVQELTSITLQMVEDAPSLKNVLEEFKLFVEDDIIVAHNIGFDYKYISDSLDYYNLGGLANRSLCTIELTKKLFKLEKYGLKTLIEFFNIENLSHHRAYDDAYATMVIFEHCLKQLPYNIKTVEDLLHF